MMLQVRLGVLRGYLAENSDQVQQVKDELEQLERRLGAIPELQSELLRLIRDTNLPMSRVALESGFRSVRRFNDSIRKVYGRTPSELRRMGRSAAPLKLARAQ